MSQKKVYRKNDHKIQIGQIDPDALKIAQKLQERGYTAYLVGGCVRDLLLGHTPKDWDISTSARPEEVKSLFRSALLIGRRFQLAHVRVGRKVFEVSTFRKGSNDSEELILSDNNWGTEEEDVLRRDFTINGLFYNPSSEEIIDYVGGLEDVKRKALNVIGQPHMRFRQDPVRMLRLIKFKARFDLDILPETITMMCELKEELFKSAPARVLEEILRMLESSSAFTFFKLLSDYGFTELLMPKLADFIEEDTQQETLRFLELIDHYHKKAPRKFERSLMMAALFMGPLKKYLDVVIAKKKGKIHLGIIQDAAHSITQDACAPYLVLPRKLASDIAILLTNQFRLTPFESKPRPLHRLPNVPLMDLSIQLLALRAKIDESLMPIYKTCKQLFQNYES